MDNLEIYILPSSNPDGSHYSMHNFGSAAAQHDEPLRRRREGDRRSVRGELLDAAGEPGHRHEPYVNSDPGSRDRLGRRPEPEQHVRHALRRLHRRVVLLHQRRVRGPGGGVRAGDQERVLDRGHVRQHQVLEQHPQLRRLLHVGAGHVPAGPRRGRRGAREHRRREVLLRGRRPDPQPDQGGTQHGDPAERTGPIADVLYSAAGNSADEHWYNRDVIAYSFETGADRFVDTDAHGAAGAGATGIRVAEPHRRRRRRPDDDRQGHAERRSPASSRRSSHRTRRAPIRTSLFTERLALSHPAGAVVAGPTIQPASGSSRTTTRRASSRRSSSRRATTACWSRRSTTPVTTSGRGSG